VSAVADDVVTRTIEHLSDVVADVVRFQRLTGCRPVEVRMIRPCDLDSGDDVWACPPESHKTEHHGAKL
jgi:integrase